MIVSQLETSFKWFWQFCWRKIDEYLAEEKHKQNNESKFSTFPSSANHEKTYFMEIQNIISGFMGKSSDQNPKRTVEPVDAEFKRMEMHSPMLEH